MPPIPPRPLKPASAQEPFVADFSEGLETGLYLALLELIDEGLIITGDEVMIDANSAACRLLERDYRQIAGKPLSELFPSERAFLEARERLLIQGEMRGSLQVALPGGRRRDMRFIAAARLRPGMHALIISPDTIAEAYGRGQPSAEDRVWPRLAAALEQPLVVVDDTGRIQALNAAAGRSPGFDGEDARGERLEDRFAVIWPESAESPHARLSRPGVDDCYARILPGPRAGWKLLLLNASAPATASAAERSDRTTAGRNAAIRLAFDHGQFSLALHPVVSVGRNRVVGAHAELVWDHPGRGMLTHDDYREEAGEADLLGDLDHHLMRFAFEAAALWPKGGEPLTLSITLDAPLRDDCAGRVYECLSTSGLDASRLEIALSGTAVAAAAHVLQHLHTHGIHFAIANAGTGVLPLPELAAGTFNTLHLAAELVNGLGHDDRGEALIEALLGISAPLGLRLVACGVETAAQRDFLAATGFDLQQGPLFGPALSASGLANRLRAERRTTQ